MAVSDGLLTVWLNRNGRRSWRPIDCNKACRPFVEERCPEGVLLNVGSGRREKQWDGRWVNIDGPWAGPDVVLDLERSLPFRDGAFAGVVAKHVLEHLFEMEAAFLELVRTCEPGGLVVCDCPLDEPEGLIVEERRAFNREKSNGHARNVTPKTWGRLARLTAGETRLLSVEAKKDVRWHDTFAVFEVLG